MRTARFPGAAALAAAMAAVAVALTASVVALAGPASAAPAGEAASLFAEGNDRYAAGDFDGAALRYRQLLNQGYRSEAIHYNLGNALYKLGRIGPAILEYEKAAVMAPNDPDVRANLEFLRSLTADKTTAGAQTATFFVERLLAFSTVDQDAAVFTVLYLLAGAIAGVRIVAPRGGRRGARVRRAAVWALAIVAVPLALSGGSLALKIYRSASLTHAVVLEERLDVRSGPGDDNTTLFTVHEGLKVRIRDTQGSWAQVSLENGLNGWVPAGALGVI